MAGLCNCNHSIRGADDDELFGEVLAHLGREHPAMLFPEERIRRFVAIRAYNVEEHAAVYPDGEGPDEESSVSNLTEPPRCCCVAGGKPLLRPQEEQQAHVGMRVRVHEDYRISELGGMVGKVVGSYGAEEFVALEVHFPDGRYRLFWPGDLEEVGSPKPSWWRSLLGRRRRS